MGMALDRDQEAIIEELYRKMYKKLYLYAVNALDHENLAEEAVQDTFRIACMKPNDLISSVNPEGWLMVVLKNVIRNIRRSQSSLNNLIISGITVDDIDLPDESTGDIGFEVTYKDIFGKEDFKLLKMMADRYTMLEISDELGISVEACKKRVQRVRKKYKKYFE